MNGYTSNEAQIKIISSLDLPKAEKFKLNTLKETKKLLYFLVVENSRIANELATIERAREKMRKKRPKLETFKGFKSVEQFNLKTLKRINVYYTIGTCAEKLKVRQSIIKEYLIDGKGNGFGWRFVANEKPCILCNSFKVESTQYQIRDKKLSYYYGHCLECDDKIKAERSRKAKARRNEV